MIVDVTKVEVLEPYRLRLEFDDGTSGVVDIAEHVRFRGVFAPLRDPEAFRQVRVDPELGTIAWPNGADLDPFVLHEWAQGRDPVQPALEADRTAGTMIVDVTRVEVLKPYRLRLEFDDGTAGEVDISELVQFDGVFAPLRDPEVFRQVRIDEEFGTIVWPNGADLDPFVLHEWAHGRRI